MRSRFAFSPWLPFSVGLFLALTSSGCGGGGGGGGSAPTTLTKISSITPVGNAIAITAGQPWSAQFLNGQWVMCGIFNGSAGAYVGGEFHVLPLSIPGGSNYSPLFMAGSIVYGSYSGGNFSWNLATNAVADTGGKQAVAVSPNGQYAAFETSGTGSVLHVATNTEVALPVQEISAVSTTGSGVCQTTTANPSSYRFSSSGSISKSALTGGSAASYVIQAANPNGLLIGEFGGLPGIWQSGSERPTALGIPGGNNGFALTLNTGGAVAGTYGSTSTSGGFALLWPNAASQPNVFVDVNGQFPLPNGGVLNAIYAMDPNSLNFVGLVTNSNGSLSIQTFSVN